MNTDFTFEENTFDIEDSEDVIGLAKSLVNGKHPGILSTVDAEGKPQLRWMATLSFEEFPIFQSLTSSNSRKVAEIAHSPQVNWMFFNHDMSIVLNLRGTAKVIADPEEIERVKARIAGVDHAYFQNGFLEERGMVIVETTVETIECTLPKNSFRFNLIPVALAGAC